LSISTCSSSLSNSKTWSSTILSQPTRPCLSFLSTTIIDTPLILLNSSSNTKSTCISFLLSFLLSFTTFTWYVKCFEKLFKIFLVPSTNSLRNNRRSSETFLLSNLLLHNLHAKHVDRWDGNLPRKSREIDKRSRPLRNACRLKNDILLHNAVYLYLYEKKLSQMNQKPTQSHKIKHSFMISKSLLNFQIYLSHIKLVSQLQSALSLKNKTSKKSLTVLVRCESFSNRSLLIPPNR